MARRRVVITGMGAVSAAGAGVGRFWDACVEGRSALRPLPQGEAAEARFREPPFPPDLASTIANRFGWVESLPPGRGGEEPAAHFALAAAAEALEAAALEPASLPASSGLALGTCLGGALTRFEWLAASRSGPTLQAARLRLGSFSAPAQRLAATLGLRGPVQTLSTACASGTTAIAHAADVIRRGEADLMLAGGTDALSSFVISGFALLRALTSGLVRPFDRRRDGLALGEGAGILVLEDREYARRRGAPIVAEILGSGSGGDANHMTGPSPTGDGLVRAIESALQDAGRPAEALDFVSAHGTGTSFNDRMESIALKRALGRRAARIPIDSIKPIIGHTMGTAGALEAILCACTIKSGVVAPTLNHEEPDSDCDLDYVPNTARRHSVRCALSCSSAFAGSNAALLLAAP